MMTNRFSTLLILFCLLAAPAKAAPLTISLEKWPGEVHPMRSITLEAVLIANQVYEPLVTIGPSGEILPGLLESWSYEPAKKTFQFKLKNGIRFSDGTPLTSEHIVHNFKQIIAENRVQNFSRIKGAKAYFEKRTLSVAGLRTQGPSHLSLELDIAYPRFLADLADPYASIFLEISKSTLPLGTGPYIFQKISADSKQIVLTRNPLTPPGAVGFNQLTFTTGSSNQANLYLHEPEKTLAAQTLKKREYLDTEVVFLSFNAAHPSLRDIHIRRYLSSLLTRQMIDETLGPVPYKLGGYIPYGIAGHQPELTLKEEAAPTGLPSVLTLSNYLPKTAPLAKAYCAALTKKGIRCELRPQSADEIFKSKKDGSLQIFFLRQKSTTYSVEYLLSCFTSQSLFNVFTSSQSNTAVTHQLDRLFNQMLQTPADQKSRLLDLYRQMDTAILDHALIKPVRYGVNKALWYDQSLKVPELDTLGPFGMKLKDIKPQE